MRLPKVIERLIEHFERLPGIGPKTAQRLTFYLLHFPQEELDSFAQKLSDLKKKTIICSVCKNVDEEDPCFICSDSSRDKSIICVVEQSLDMLAIEKSEKYQGVYHVLHGKIDPLNNIGPDEIYIVQLLKRLNDSITEVILATNPNMEGEATAMYIKKEIKRLGKQNIRTTRLAHGLPVGADLEYADRETLKNALVGRQEY